jgi:hypothetical protein
MVDPADIDSADDDSFEVHYDEKRGHLELACAPKSYRRFRDFVSEELADFKEINLDRVREIEILDAHSITGQSPSNLQNAGCIALAIILCAILLIGGITIAHWFIR